MLNCTIAEGVRRKDSMTLPTPIAKIDELQAVFADEFFSLHKWPDEK